VAANYSATIQLIVEGQQRLDKLQNQVSALNKQLKELARLDIGGVFEDPLLGGAVAKLRAARNEQVSALKQTGQQQDLVNRKLESQLLNQIRLNSAVDLYKRRLNEVSRTAAPEQAQFKGRLQELDQAFQFFKGKGSVAGVQATATELGRIVEYSREVTRLELGRVKSSQQIKDYTSQIERLRAAGLDTAKAEAVLDKFAINAGTNKYKLAEKYKIVLDSRLKTLNEELRLQKQIAAAETRQGAGFRGRASGAISSAVIGGGFPLLFGQGAAAAVGGGLGGLAGGLLGGGFGFALSIAGTAIGDLITQTETLDKSLATLNSSLSTVGSSSLTTADDVKELAKNLGVTKEEAIALIGTFSQFRDAGTREALASLFGNVGGAATFEAIARAGIDEKNALSSIFSLRQQIGNEAATQLALQLDAVGATETQATLLKLVVEQSIRSSVAAAQQVKYTDNLLSTWENIVGAVAAGLSLAIKFIQKMQEGALIQLPFLTQIQQFLQGKKGRSGQQIADERAVQLEKSLRSQLEAARRAVRQETGTLGVESMLTDRGRNSDKAARDAARLAEQRQKQLEAAARMAVSTDTQLKKAAAINKEEQLAADMDQQRMERMVRYETLYRDALSNAEIEYLLTAQTNEILAEKLNHEQAILDIRLEQSRLLNEADPLKNAQQEIDLLAAKIQGKEEEYLRQQAIDELVSRGVVLEDAIAHVDAIKALNASLQQQLALEQLVASVGQGMGNALTGVFDALIARADNFNEVMANTLASLGRFLMMAGLNALADLGDPSGQGVGILSFLGFGKGFGKRASGGPVKGGVPFVVGERGPELFVPGTSGGVMSNSDLRASMGAAPGANGGPVLNMTFETSTINGVEYVSRDQLEAAMVQTRRQAARDGAQRGMSMTLDKLQQSPSTRKRVGF